jgi:hypothetical protein
VIHTARSILTTLCGIVPSHALTWAYVRVFTTPQAHVGSARLRAQQARPWMVLGDVAQRVSTMSSMVRKFVWKHALADIHSRRFQMG